MTISYPMALLLTTCAIALILFKLGQMDLSFLDEKPSEKMTGITVPAVFVDCIDQPTIEKIVASCGAYSNTYFVTNGEFSLHELIRALADRMPVIDELVLSSFSFTEMPTRLLGELKESGKVKKLYVLADTRARANYPGVVQQLRIISDAMAIAPVHAKVTVLHSSKINYTVIGSANWTTNPRYETGFITMDNKVADFNRQWILQAISDKIKSNGLEH